MIKNETLLLKVILLNTIRINKYFTAKNTHVQQTEHGHFYIKFIQIVINYQLDVRRHVVDFVQWVLKQSFDDVDHLEV